MMSHERVPAIVLGCVVPGEPRIILHPGVGHLDGGVPTDVPAAAIPAALRLPNTRLWIHFDGNWKIVRAWARDDE